MSRSGIVNVRMVITEEKILSNMDKVQKLINPNSKKQIVQLEEDAFFKDLIESIKTYLIEYPKKKNFPKAVYKTAYELVEYATNQFEENTKKIEELDTKIDEAMANQSTLPASDLKILENQIEEKLDSIYNVNDLEIIKENKKDINTYITKKAKIAGEKSPAGSYLKKLIDERSKYENELNSGAEYVTSPESGVVSYKVDGYENILTTANFNYLNKDFLKSLKLKVEL